MIAIAMPSLPELLLLLLLLLLFLGVLTAITVDIVIVVKKEVQMRMLETRQIRHPLRNPKITLR